MAKAVRGITINDADDSHTLTGTEGADVILGNGGDDSIYGLGGNDDLRGNLVMIRSMVALAMTPSLATKAMIASMAATGTIPFTATEEMTSSTAVPVMMLSAWAQKTTQSRAALEPIVSFSLKTGPKRVA